VQKVPYRGILAVVEQEQLSAWVKAYAQSLGFDLAGIAPAVRPPHGEHLIWWLQQGYAGEMEYMERTAEQRLDPQTLLPGAKSAVVVGLNYAPAQLPATDYRIARYAMGEDYHAVIRSKLETLLGAIRALLPDCEGRVCVDSAPVLERDLAWLAGLGWYGKNTCLINTRRGSYFFIGVLLLTVELAYDHPAFGGCGRCRKCLDACPTGAIRAPYVLDARRCISYLTIEQRGAIPEELREPMGDWLFGCDICQEVCPFNQPRPHQPWRAAPTSEPRLQPRPLPTLAQILAMDETEFRQQFQGSPIRRAKWRGLVRNALIVAGNRGDPRYLPLIERFLNHPDPLLRAHARWAKAQISRKADEGNRCPETA